MKKSKNLGFTLIELMIVVLIIGILVGVAYPSYRDHIVRTKRSDAMGTLVAASTAIERYRSSNNFSYTGATLGTGGVYVNTVPKDGGDPYYSLTLVLTATTYTLTATPVGGSSQAGDGNLTLNNIGQKTWGGGSGWPKY